MTIQLKWVDLNDETGIREIVDTPEQANTIGMYIGEPGTYKWVADFSDSRADLAVVCATHLANVLNTDVDAPGSMGEGVSVRDGFVPFGAEVWWRSEYGPQKVRLLKNSSHGENATRHPECYSIGVPVYKAIYKD